MHRPSLLGEVHFLCLLCGAARRRLSYAKRAITEWLERTCSFIIFVHGREAPVALALRWPKAVALALSIYAVFRGIFLPIGSTLTLFYIIFLNSCCDI